MKQPSRSPDSILSTLISEVRKTVVTRSPVTKEESAFLERSRQWMVDMASVSDRSNQLIAKGDMGAAQKLCDDFNATKPKRRAGRPRIVAPSDKLLSKVTLDVLLLEVIPALSSKQRAHVIEAAASEIIDRIA
jgi:hypothetical protein